MSFSLPLLLCLWPISLFLSEPQRSRQAAALADGNRLRLTSRHQAARTPDAVALRPRHNAGVMVAAGLGRSPAWGRSVVAGQLWSPWDIPRGNQTQREAGSEMYGSRS